jgi:molecular chaperone Hsp33
MGTLLRLAYLKPQDRGGPIMLERSITRNKELFMSKESRLYSFLNQEKGVLVHFLDGQETLNHICSLYDFSHEAKDFYKAIILGLETMISFLKAGEGFGVYIDSDSPYFRFKIETNDSGRYRTLLMPHTLENIPAKITGICRFTKILPGNKNPYTTILDFKDKTLPEILNTILKDSFQFNANLSIDLDANQAMLVHRLPDLQIDKTYRENRPELKELVQLFSSDFDKLAGIQDKTQGDIQSTFEQKTLSFIGSKKIHFECNCSKERMATGIVSLVNSQGFDHVFEQDKTIEANCDYCLTSYVFTREEIESMYAASKKLTN